MPLSPKRTIVAINGNGGAYVNIPVTGTYRNIDIRECPASNGTFAPQGLQYKLKDDNYTAVFQNPAPSGDSLHNIHLGNPLAAGSGAGGIVGFIARTTPSGESIAAMIPIKILSATATATQVLVEES